MTNGYRDYVTLSRPLVDEMAAGVECEIHRGPPLLDPNDLGVIRGFGAFEVVHGRGNQLLAFDSHMDRFDRSLSKLGMPVLDREAWRRATVEIMRNPCGDNEEIALRYVVTPGGDSDPTGWIHRANSSPSLAERRLKPRSVMTLSRGVALGESGDLAWLLTA